jgi:hypothetical protein
MFKVLILKSLTIFPIRIRSCLFGIVYRFANFLVWDFPNVYERQEFFAYSADLGSENNPLMPFQHLGK